VSEVKTSRRYTSGVREESARNTRARVLNAAESLFAADGYVATTVDLIASTAGVSKPTVFASVGSKRAILVLLRDRALAGDDEPVPVAQRAWYQEALNEPDQRRSLRLHARNVVNIKLRVATMDLVLERAAGADPELAQLWDEAQRTRRMGAQLVVNALADKGPLRPGLSKRAAVDLLWTLSASGLFQSMVVDSGWSRQRYESWLADLFCAQLLP
jgi:AcrR family transcriptional regulator